MYLYESGYSWRNKCEDAEVVIDHHNKLNSRKANVYAISTLYP